uniref:WD repeat domain 62 n=1 Tax=Fundulus heteroclitus TaxID=8078 RepID=A0A3Q2QZI8_FUNHE
ALQSLEQLVKIEAHDSEVLCLEFSPASTGEQRGAIIASNKVSSRVFSVSCSQDGSRFVTAGNRHVKFWDLDASKERRVNSTVPLIGRSGLLGDHRNAVFCGVACGRGLTATNTYCVTTGGVLCQFNGSRQLEAWVDLKTAAASSLAVSDDFVFCSCADGVVRVFRPSDLQYVGSLPRPHRLGVDLSRSAPHSPSPAGSEAPHPDTLALTFDPRGRRLACVYSDHSVYVWDVRDARNAGKLYSALYHSSCVWNIQVYPELEDPSQACLPPSSFLTCSSDNTIRLWHSDASVRHSNRYSQVSPAPGEPSASESNNLNNNKLKFQTSCTNFLFIYFRLSGCIDSCTFDQSTAEGLTFSRRHHVVEKTTLYDMDLDPTGTRVAIERQRLGERRRRSVQMDPSGSFFATSCSDKNISVFDSDSGECVATLFGHSELVSCMKFSQDCRHLISASGDSCVFVWRLDPQMTGAMRKRRALQASRAAKSRSLSRPSIRRETFITVPSSHCCLGLMWIFKCSGVEPAGLLRRFWINPPLCVPETSLLQTNGKLPMWFRKLVGSLWFCRYGAGPVPAGGSSNLCLLQAEADGAVQSEPEPHQARGQWAERLNPLSICSNFSPSPSRSQEEEEEEEEFQPQSLDSLLGDEEEEVSLQTLMKSHPAFLVLISVLNSAADGGSKQNLHPPPRL